MKSPRLLKLKLYISVFAVTYVFAFFITWLRSAIRASSVTQPNLTTMSLLGISVFAALVAAGAVFQFGRKRG